MRSVLRAVLQESGKTIRRLPTPRSSIETFMARAQPLSSFGQLRAFGCSPFEPRSRYVWYLWLGVRDWKSAMGATRATAAQRCMHAFKRCGCVHRAYV